MELNVKFDLPFEWCTLCDAFNISGTGRCYGPNGIIEHNLPGCANDGICKAMADAHDKFLNIMREEQKNGNN